MLLKIQLVPFPPWLCFPTWPLALLPTLYTTHFSFDALTSVETLCEQGCVGSLLVPRAGMD
jgi:hypothetical protein